MKNVFIILLALLVSACGSKLDGTYSNNMTGVGEQTMRITFKPDGTAHMSIGSTDIPLEMPYEFTGNKIKVVGQNGDIIFTVLDDGDLLEGGLRYKKENTSQSVVTKPVEASPTPKPSEQTITTTTVVSEPKAVSEMPPNSEQPQALPQATWAPSFDCAKASTFTEKTICSDPILGNLDGALSENYKYMLASDIGDGARANIKETQKKWLKERNKCTSSQCLADAYRKRIDEVCEYPVISGVHPICTSSDEIK